MKLTKLVIKNFLSVKEATLYLGDKGLVSIEGINKDATGSDSNGSGKSSIINAILWCCYGSYGKDGASDDVVNSLSKQDCSVQTEWREDSRCYDIIRYRKHKRHNNSIVVQLDGKDITKAGATAVQAQINEILGGNETIFRAQCFAQQENPIDIPAMTDSKLKALLEDCLPLDNLAPLYRKATENVTTQMGVVSKLKDERDLKTWQIDRNKEDLKEALDLRIKWTKENDTKEARLNEQIKYKNVARGIALGLSNKRGLEAEIADVEFRISSIGPSDYLTDSYKHNEAAKRVAEIREQIDNPPNKCTKCGQEVEDESELVARLVVEHGKADKLLTELRDKAKVSSYNHVQKKTLERELQELQKQVTECNRNADAADRLESEISLLEAQKVAVGINPHNETVTRLRGYLKAAIEGHKSYQEKLTEAEARLEVLKAVQLTYSPKGLRYHILEKVAPKLTADTNRYLQVLTDGSIEAVWSTVTRTASGDFKEKFSIEARMEGRTNFGLLSGGEKRKVRLACFFALQDLIASQATKNIELWVGDEIDVALDSAGMERLMGVLAEKTKSKSTILVISHNEMREWIPNYATVTRKDGVSTITGYLNVD
jgi:DNA repair exonuclease SbcCD ATPase subunit